MARNKSKKLSKRQPARQRYKVLRKIREHNRKLRKEAKKNPNKNKPKTVQIPNICPFKSEILKEAEQLKAQKEEEKARQKQERQIQKQSDKIKLSHNGLEGLVKNAEIRGKLHENFTPIETDKTLNETPDKSLKAYYKEFRNVIEAADVVLEIVDARDPLGTRCKQVEQAVNSLGKRLVLVLNKSDLIPRENLDKWLKYLKRTVPTIPFKASTQDQTRKLGQKKYTKAAKVFEGSTSVGTEMLMSLLANYCRNKDIRTSITVGLVGLPNVGKSSIINSLKRSRACNVGATPGVTRQMQEVQLDSKIKLLDSPGIVFSAGTDGSAALRNSIKVTNLLDPITPANAILQRVSKLQIMEMYDVNEFSTPEEFYSLKAARMGRFKKGGVPDKMAAARSLLEDWNNGRIKYYTLPPEDNPNDVHVSSSIVNEAVKEFDLDNFEMMESETINEIQENAEDVNGCFVMESMGPIENESLLSENINVVTTKKSKTHKETVEKQPELLLAENQSLNKIQKLAFKKMKKQRRRREKVALQLSEGLENLNFD